jgi:hypothetical protein
MDFPEVASHPFEANRIEVALAAGKAFMHVKLWMWYRSVRTNRETTGVPELMQVLTQTSRQSRSQFLRNAVLLVKVGSDLGVCSSESVLAPATDKGTTLNVHV